MKLCQMAVLSLVGWYLILPPATETLVFNPNAGLGMDSIC